MDKKKDVSKVKKPAVVAKKPVVKKSEDADVKSVKASEDAAVRRKVPVDHHYGTGKRKSAIAKVWLYPGTGVITINKMPAIEYLNTEILVSDILKPLKKLGIASSFDCTISCLGGGLVGQARACQLGIARALLGVSVDNRKILKEEGFLTRDARVKERKKYGKKKARKGFQFRKR